MKRPIPPQPPTTLRPPTIPSCGGCGRSGVVLFQGMCERCTAADERDEEADRG